MRQERSHLCETGKEKTDQTELVYSYLVNGDDGSEEGGEKPSDGGTGLISFDLTTTTTDPYAIERLAVLDTIKSHHYARRVAKLVACMDGEFPKELLAVWWA